MRDALQRIWLERKITLVIMAIVMALAVAINALHGIVTRPTESPAINETVSGSM